MKLYVGAFLASFIVAGLALFSFKSVPSVDSQPDSKGSDAIHLVEKNATTSKLETSDPETLGNPFAILALQSVDEIESQLNDLAKDSGLPMNATEFSALHASQFLSAIDRKKPLGAMAWGTSKNFDPEYLICLPIKDLESFKKNIGQRHILTERNGELLLNFGGDKFFARQHQEYLVVSSHRRRLQNCPKNPAEFFQSSTANKTLQLTIFVQLIPRKWRDLYWDGYSRGATQNPDLEMKALMEPMRELIFETDRIEIGWQIVSKNRQVVIETELTGVKGSNFEKASQKEFDLSPSRFSGFELSDAVMDFSVNNGSFGNVLRDMRDNAVKMVTQFREMMPATEDTPRFLGDLNQVFESIVATGRCNIGLSVTNKNGHSKLVAGIHAAETGRLEKLLLQAFDYIKSNGVKTKCRTIEDTKRAITFYEFIGEKKFGNGFGKTLNIGIAKDAVYVGMGDESFETLLKCIDDSETSSEKRNSMRFRVDGFDLIQMLGRDTISRNGWRKLKKLLDYDEFLFVSKPTPQGSVYRTEIQVGVLAMLVGAVEKIGQVSEAEFQSIADDLKEAEAEGRNENK